MILRGDRIQQLDGLRGIAILSVFLHHALAISFLWIGVDIFFVLSGFLITGILLDYKADGRSYFRRFYFRRARRIIIPCALVMLISSVLFGTAWLRHWYWYALFASNISLAFFHGDSVTLGMLWSLAVEEQFYFVWPVVVLAPRRIVTLMAGALVIAAPLLRAICTPLFRNHFPIYYLTPFRMDLLACGALACLAYRKHPGRVRSLSGIAQAALVTLAIAIPVISRLGSLRTGTNTMFSNVLVFELSLAVAVSTLIVALNDDSWLSAILRARWLRGVGIISYSMYLIHLTFLTIFRTHLQNTCIIAIAAFACTLLYSALSWRLIESRLLRQTSGSVSVLQRRKSALHFGKVTLPWPATGDPRLRS